MNNLKTHIIILCIALIMMLVSGIMLIVGYKSGKATEPKGIWILFAVMELVAISQLLIIRDIKKKGRD